MTTNKKQLVDDLQEFTRRSCMSVSAVAKVYGISPAALRRWFDDEAEPAEHIARQVRRKLDSVSAVENIYQRLAELPQNKKMALVKGVIQNIEW